MASAQRPSRIWSWLEAGLTPAIELGDRLRTSQKLVLVGLLALVPVGWLIVSIESEISGLKQFGEREIQGVQYLRRLLTVLPLVSQARLAGGRGGTARDGPADPFIRVSEEVDALRLLETEFGREIESTQGFEALGKAWRTLRERRSATGDGGEDELYDTVWYQARELIALVGDSSSLILDPDLETCHLRDALLLKIPEGLDLLDRVSRRGRQEKRSGGAAISSLLRANREATMRAFRGAASSARSPLTRRTLLAALDSYLEQLDGVLARLETAPGGEKGATAVLPPVLVSSAMNAGGALAAASADELEHTIRGRVEALERRRWTVLGGTLASVVLVSYVGTAIYIGTMRTVSRCLREENSRALDESSRAREAEARFRQSETRLRLIIDLAMDAVTLLDERGRVLEWNPQAELTFGWTRAEAEGQPLSDLVFPPAGREEFLRLLGSIHEPHEAHLPGIRCEREMVRKDGHAVPVELSLTPVRAGDSRAFSVFLRDISDRRRAEAEAKRADEFRVTKEAAEAASRTKSEFLANMSHEIRTPMNGIIGMTELALETGLSRQQRVYLDMVKVSAESLLTIINDILDFSKIEAGKLELSPAPFRLRALVEETVATLAVRAHGKGLELACRIAPELPDAVVGDAGRLRQVLVNLLSNAVKFTEQGEITLSVESEADAGDDLGLLPLRFSVADTGIGIPVDRVSAVFEPFEQADNSTTRRYGGTGLGLAISKKLAAMMGGRIWVESDFGRGSTFQVSIRLQRCNDEQAFQERPGRSSLEDLRVLVVDDNATNRRILEEVLGSWGVQPEAAANGAAALELLTDAANRGMPFSAAVLDGMMPGMDGAELARRIRAEPRLAVTELILMSSDGSVLGPDSVSRSVFAATLSKPLRQSELYDALVSAIGPSPAPGMASVPFGEPATVSRPAEVLTEVPSALRVLLAEDHPVNQKVAASYLEKAGHRVTIVGDGSQAVEAVRTGEFDVVFMDVQMPVMDGFEALELIRELPDPVRRSTPVIALTAHAMKGDRDRCLNAGFDSYLAKPVRSAELYEALSTITPRRHTPLGWSADSYNSLVSRCGGDEEFACELIGLFLDSIPRSLAAIHDAVGAGDLSALGQHAHGLKGACLTIGADGLAEACLRLELLARDRDGAPVREAAEAVTRLVAELEPELRAHGVVSS